MQPQSSFVAPRPEHDEPPTSSARPALAEGVRLIGDLPSSGFEQPQGLVQRGDKFIQITELLYRVLQQIDGRHTIEEIAENVRNSSDWAITPDQVQYLIVNKLSPLGLITTDDERRCEAVNSNAPSSPLGVYLRMKMIGPHIIDPVARILQFLFWTPVLVPIIAAIIGAHFWLYRIHGVARSLDAALAAPGGLPLVIAMVILSAIFHEFGHAAALRFGGGHVRGMGVGLYIVYPAFYTDVTDAYRLGRWARVRTDIGGVYFNAISCVALILISRLTGMESLLLAVVLINAEMLRQFIPLVRLDGYWLFADLTGIPDLFSLMQPFLLSFAPESSGKASRLPRLRRWVAVTFGLYILAVIPALAYFGFLMVKNLPSFVDKAFSAVWQQSFALATAARTGEIGTAFLLTLTVLLLGGSIIGTFYLAVIMPARPMARAWRSGRGRAPLRVAVAAAALLIAIFLGLLWRPDLERIYARLNPPAPAILAAKLVRAASSATAKIPSLTADLDGEFNSDPFTGSVALKRPNLARVEVSSPGGLGRFTVVSDGRSVNTLFPSENRYVQGAPGPNGANIRVYVADPIEYFFRPEKLTDMVKTGTLSYSEEVATAGTTYDVVQYASTRTPNQYTRLAIARTDHLVHAVFVTTRLSDGKYSESWARLKNVRIGANLDNAVFAWRAPEGSGQQLFPAGVTMPALPTGKAAVP